VVLQGVERIQYVELQRTLLTNIILILPILTLLLAAAAPARAEVSATLDMNALSRGYQMACEGQAAMRHENILPPEFPGRPREFNNDKEALVIYSPHLTAEQRKKAEKLFASVPTYALPVIWRGGGVYVFTRRAIVEAVPALAVERGWFNDHGLYLDSERRLYIPFEKGEALQRKGGKYVARRFVPSEREPFRIINHETGHMIDSMLGAFSLNSKGEDGKTRLTNSPGFLAAFNADLSRLASKKRQISIEKIRKLGYYMPHSYKGVRLGIQPDQRARREVFAELWAEVHGHGKSELRIAYPDTFQMVKAIVNFLQEQDKAAPARCPLP